MQRLILAFIATTLVSCGGSSSKKSVAPGAASSGTTINLSQESYLRFYAASGIGVSATSYVLRPSAQTLQKYVPGSGSTLEVEKSVDLTAAQLSALTTPLSKLATNTWPLCTTCNATERTVWVEIPDGSYHYGTVSNCYCSGSSDKPTLTYSEINNLYQAILAYFP